MAAGSDFPCFIQKNVLLPSQIPTDTGAGIALSSFFRNKLTCHISVSESVCVKEGLPVRCTSFATKPINEAGLIVSNSDCSCLPFFFHNCGWEDTCASYVGNRGQVCVAKSIGRNRCEHPILILRRSVQTGRSSIHG
jgi:hypothetical protein